MIIANKNRVIKKKKKKMPSDIENIVIVVIKYLEISKILALNNP